MPFRLVALAGGSARPGCLFRVYVAQEFRGRLKLDPVEYMQSSMLFAWADDITAQEKIMALNTMDEIKAFFKSPKTKNRIFFFDQLNGMNDDPEEGKRVMRWLMRCTSGSTRVFSSSANYADYIGQSHKQSSNLVLPVCGGLATVSHLIIYVTMR